jgi:hypothetical protein
LSCRCVLTPPVRVKTHDLGRRPPGLESARDVSALRQIAGSLGEIGLVADPAGGFVVFEILESADVTMEGPLQHVQPGANVTVVSYDCAAVEMGVADLVGQITPGAFLKTGEIFAE